MAALIHSKAHEQNKGDHHANAKHGT